MRIVLKRCTIAIMLLVIIISLLGCSKISELFKSEEGETKVEFKEDTVLAVGNQLVSLSEWYLYMEPVVSRTESIYGKDIWDYKVNTEGRTFADAMKEDVKQRVLYIKIICEQADKLGVNLDEDALIDVNLQAQEYMEKLTEAQKKEYDISMDTVKQIYRDNMLAMNVYEHLTLNVDMNIPAKELKQYIKDNGGDSNDEEALDKARIAIIEERQQNIFDSAYEEWEKAAVIRINNTVYDNISIS